MLTFKHVYAVWSDMNNEIPEKWESNSEAYVALQSLVDASATASCCVVAVSICAQPTDQCINKG